MFIYMKIKSKKTTKNSSLLGLKIDRLIKRLNKPITTKNLPRNLLNGSKSMIQQNMSSKLMSLTKNSTIASYG
jgi:hypothetical protein